MSESLSTRTVAVACYWLLTGHDESSVAVFLLVLNFFVLKEWQSGIVVAPLTALVMLHAHHVMFLRLCCCCCSSASHRPFKHVRISWRCGSCCSCCWCISCCRPHLCLIHHVGSLRYYRLKKVENWQSAIDFQMARLLLIRGDPGYLLSMTAA